MGFTLGPNYETEADKWTSFVRLCLAQDFNYIAFEGTANCICLIHTKYFYRFEFRDESVLDIYWDSNNDCWNTGLLWIQRYATEKFEGKPTLGY